LAQISVARADDDDVRFLRAIKVVGWAVLAVAVPIAIFDPDARPSAHVLVIGVGVGAVIGVAGGLVFRYSLPLERRLQFFRSLSLRLARRLMPPPKDTEGTS